MTDYRFEYIKNQMIDELLVEQQKSKILMEQQKSNDEKIRQLKEDIAINKEKLQKLEELQRTKSPVEEAFKKVFSHYPNEKDFREGIWFGFEKGYNASKVSETPQEEPKLRTLKDIIWDWIVIYNIRSDSVKVHITADLLERIETNWLPTERVENKYDADYNSGWNDLLDTLRRTLR